MVGQAIRYVVLQITFVVCSFIWKPKRFNLSFTSLYHICWRYILFQIPPKGEMSGLFIVGLFFFFFSERAELSHSLSCSGWIGLVSLLLSTVFVGASHVLQWQPSLLWAPRVAGWEPPPSGPRSASVSLPPPLRSFGILSGVSAALQFHSCLLWRRHTRRDEFRILHACLPACLCGCMCVCVRSQHMLSSVYREARRACDAVRAGWGHSTSSVNTSPGANAWFSILST